MGMSQFVVRRTLPPHAEELQASLSVGDQDALRRQLKLIVPEFDNAVNLGDANDHYAGWRTEAYTACRTAACTRVRLGLVSEEKEFLCRQHTLMLS